jgi:hypothetical protein
VEKQNHGIRPGNTVRLGKSKIKEMQDSKLNEGSCGNTGVAQTCKEQRKGNGP